MNISHRLKIIGIGALIAFSFAVAMSPAFAQTGFQTDPTCTLQLGAWQAAPTAPAGAYHLEGGGAVVDGRLYLLSGYDNGSFTIGNRVDVYDIPSSTWLSATIPYMPSPFRNTHVQAAADGQYIWMAGGFPNVNGSVPWTDVYRYDTLTDTWNVMPPLPLARASGALVVNSQTRMLHYFGGLADDRTTNQADHWALNLNNPAGGWTALASMPMPRNHFQALEINGVIYAPGGQFGHDGLHEDTVLLHAYDPATDTWQQLADMPLSRSHAETATFVVNERIVLIAGSDSVNGNDQVNNVTTYNPQTDTWTALTPIPVPLYGAAAGFYDNKIFVTTGGLTNFNLQLDSWQAEFIENCAPTLPPTPTLTPAPSTGSSNVVAQAQAIGVFDPALSKIGFLLPNDVGVTGEQIEWVITVNNLGNAPGTNVVITDTLRPELRIDRVDHTSGTVAINGQTVAMTFPTLAPGQSEQFSVITTVLQGRSFDNVACLTAINADQLCVTGQAISTLPNTGETSLRRMLTAAAVYGIGALITLIGAVGVLKARRALR